MRITVHAPISPYVRMRMIDETTMQVTGREQATLVRVERGNDQHATYEPTEAVRLEILHALYVAAGAPL